MPVKSLIHILRARLVLIVVAAVAAVIVSAPAQADKRVALVLGNSAYQNVARLDNPKNDARLIAETLKSLGFIVVGNGAQIDLDKPGLDRAVQAFGAQLSGADVGLFYYAGHGVQIRGANYLVPVDANPTKEADVDFQMLDINLVLRQMEGSGTKLNLVILDACRNNPFGGRGLRASDGGLAQMRAPEGTLISFATQPGNVARDGTDGNSPYTKALAATLRRPGLGIFETVNEVGLQVKRATGGAQEPWFSSSPIDGSFFFAAPIKPAAPPAAAATPDETLWSVIKNSDVAALHEEFLRQFPGSPRAVEAKSRLDALKRTQVAVVAPPAAAPQPAAPPLAVKPPAPAAKPAALTPSEPPLQAPAWSAGAADVAAWRLVATTRLGGALAKANVSVDRSMVAVTAHREGSLHVVDALTLKPRTKIKLDSYANYSLTGIAILPPGKRVAAVVSGRLEVYDTESMERLQQIAAYPNYDQGYLRLARDGQRLYVVRSSINLQRSTVGVYRIAGAELSLEAEYPFDNRIDSIDVTADGARFLLGTYPGDELVLYDARAKQVLWKQKCQCSGKFGAGDRLAVFAGRPGASAGDWDKNTVIGVLDVAQPARRATYDTRTKETIDVYDVSPDGRFAAIGSTNNGQVTIVPVALDGTDLRPITILKDNSRQSIAGASFVGSDALVTMSGDNNARRWAK